MNHVTVVGAGLAGCETAYALANRGVLVTLIEQKPKQYSPAHHSPFFSELVCSNSLRSDMLHNAVGLLKEEMRLLGSITMEAAANTKVPAGGALAVDREGFSAYITNAIKAHPNITVIERELTDLKEIEGVMVVATGPLTSDALAMSIKAELSDEYCYFYDAAAPIVSFESINMNRAFRGSRYQRGDDDYINCPMNKEEYHAFYEALIHAETAPLKEFEDEKVFEGCMPVETMAKRGVQTLLFGPLKPVGLRPPGEEKDPYAVVQLRQDNLSGTSYNLVGFQTHLKFGEQKRVFSMIPGLENAEFLRYGVMHRNTFINSPKLLSAAYQLKDQPNIFFAGQITGVEGYVESAASGLAVGLYLSQILKGKEPQIFPSSTAIGALGAYISDPNLSSFQPMNINYGIMEQLGYRVRGKQQKNLAIGEKAIEEIRKWISQEE